MAKMGLVISPDVDAVGYIFFHIHPFPVLVVADLWNRRRASEHEDSKLGIAKPFRTFVAASYRIPIGLIAKIILGMKLHPKKGTAD